MKESAQLGGSFDFTTLRLYFCRSSILFTCCTCLVYILRNDMKVWWILFYLSLYIYNRQIYISAQYFKQFFVGKGINSGTLLPPHGAETMRGWVDSIAYGCYWGGTAQIAPLSQHLATEVHMKYSNTVFTCIFDRVYMADSVMVRSVMRYGTHHQGEWVCTQGPWSFSQTQS